MVLFAFIGEIISPMVSIKPEIALPPWIFSWLIVSFPMSYIVIRYMEITIDPTKISGFCTTWGNYIQIDWQELILVKSYSLGARTISIGSMNNRRKRIHIGAWLYDLPRMLDRVRQYAGEDHPLTIALEKEVSLPREKPLRGIWRLIGVIAIILSIWLIGGNLYADYREQPLNQAIANYVRQHPKTAPNQSAIDLQAAIAKLGLSYEMFGDGSKIKVVPTKAAVAEWEKIDSAFGEYVTAQVKKASDSLDLPPAKLHDYLATHRSDIDTIQNLLINRELPDWGSDSSWLESIDYNVSKYLSNREHPSPIYLLSLQKVLIADYLDSSALNSSEMSEKVRAILRLNQLSQNKQEFSHQLINFINERSSSIILRSIDLLPKSSEKNLTNIDSDKIMQAAIEYELMSSTRYARDPKIIEYFQVEMSEKHRIPFSFILKYYHLAKPYTRVMAVDLHQKNQQNLAYWIGQNICQTKGDSYLGEPHSFINMPGVSRQYVRVKTSGLDRELTTSVRQIKSQLSLGRSIDQVASEFKLASQTCPGEQWTAKIKDGAIAISFSHPPNWTALGLDEKININRLTYRINP